jgi:polyhydroxyalkanoate synthesis regulator phasin
VATGKIICHDQLTISRTDPFTFIAQARDDVPALLAEVRRLREQVAQLQARQKPEPPG